MCHHQPTQRPQTIVIDGQEVSIPLPSWRLSFQWFMVSLQFFVAVLAVVFTFTDKLRKTHSALNGNLAFCSVLWAIEANKLYQLVRGIEGHGWLSDLLNIGYQPTQRYVVDHVCSCRSTSLLPSATIRSLLDPAF